MLFRIGIYPRLDLTEFGAIFPFLFEDYRKFLADIGAFSRCQRVELLQAVQQTHGALRVVEGHEFASNQTATWIFWIDQSRKTHRQVVEVPAAVSNPEAAYLAFDEAVEVGVALHQAAVKKEQVCLCYVKSVQVCFALGKV